MELYKVLILALIAESIWETLKMIWNKGKVSVDRIGAILVGILLSVLTGTDIMELVGVPMFIPYIGTILTGVLISRGSNFVHDIMNNMNGIYMERKTRISK
ncbi:MAG: hypothetical protein MR639_13070 [Clostridium sp.]|uniref:hypothetical protein n=1 Tax=Clostridium sp. TaxID=1506 RepID=UPI002A8570BF|nr:hypothetical protein [Clostridium sp.]MDY5099638.1 hypothetical protein [Clostridium sp.]